MTEFTNSDYYAARAAQERVRAETAQDPVVVAIHRQMAATYEKLARGIATDEKMSTWVGPD